MLELKELSIPMRGCWEKTPVPICRHTISETRFPETTEIKKGKLKAETKVPQIKHPYLQKKKKKREINKIVV